MPNYCCCTLCGCDLPFNTEDFENPLEQSLKYINHNQNILSLLRLFDILVENNSDNESDKRLNLFPDITFCDQCRRRNEDADNLFTEMDLLQRQIVELKVKIEQDFIASFNSNSNTAIDHDYDNERRFGRLLNKANDNNFTSAIKIRQLLSHRLCLDRDIIQHNNSDNVTDSPQISVHQDNSEPPIQSAVFIDLDSSDCITDAPETDQNNFEPLIQSVTSIALESPPDSSVASIVPSFSSSICTSHDNAGNNDSCITVKRPRTYSIKKDFKIIVKNIPPENWTEDKRSQIQQVPKSSGIKRGPYKKSPTNIILQRKPSGPNQPHCCPAPGCSKGFKMKEDLACHYLKAHNGVTHPYTCGICGKKFRMTRSYKAHVMSHAGEYPFKCNRARCEKGFTTQEDLDSHYLRHKSDTSFICHYCGRGFKAYAGLVYHTRKEHNDDAGLSSYECETCGRKFLRTDKLKLHMESVHATEKNFVCEICGKQFAIESYLLSHIKSMHEGNPDKTRKPRKKKTKAVDGEKMEIRTAPQEDSSAQAIKLEPDPSKLMPINELKRYYQIPKKRRTNRPINI